MTRSMRSSGFMVLISSHVLVERLEPHGPKRFILGQPLIGNLEWFGLEPVEPFPALFALVHERARCNERRCFVTPGSDIGNGAASADADTSAPLRRRNRIPASGRVT